MTFVSMILAVVVIGGLLAYMSNASSSRDHGSDQDAFKEPADGAVQPTLDTEFVVRHWAEIQQMMKAGGAGLKNALIEADKLLDYVMQAKGFHGETMGERLKSGGSKFSDLNSIWAAHKLRNQYAHEVHIDVVPREVEQAVAKLGQGLRDLGVAV